MHAPSALESFVSMRTVSYDGTAGWTTGLIAKENGRVRVHRIDSDAVECDLSPALTVHLMRRGYLQPGARKAWRYTGNDLATLAATLGDALARTELPLVTTMAVILHHVALISAANLSAWAHSFGIERCDVADIEITVEDLRAALPASRIDFGKAQGVLATLGENLGSQGTDARYRDALTVQTTLEHVTEVAKRPPVSTKA